MTTRDIKDRLWNRCDWCGRFIAITDFNNGAHRALFTPDTAFTSESYSTRCRKCQEKFKKAFPYKVVA